MIKIDKGIPTPERSGKIVYPFSEMKVGDSFAFPKEKLQSVYRLSQYYRKGTTKKFSVQCKQNDEEGRCWRIK